MLRIIFSLVSAVFLISGGLHAQESTSQSNDIEAIIAKIKQSQDCESCAKICREALESSKTYEDYEKLAASLKDFIDKHNDYQCPAAIYFAIGKTRVEGLNYLARKNDIESGRIYMSVNERSYNEALDSLEKGEKASANKDTSLDISLLRLHIFKELFQIQKADLCFDDIIGKIASYSEDKNKNIAKLNEISKKLADEGMNDYAMKLKFSFASKVDPQSAKLLAEDIRSSADKYVDEGNVKEALSTYDIYIQLGEKYYDQASMASKIMEIAENYFNRKRYKDAIKYYSAHISRYANSQVADYANYKLALSYYNDRDSAAAVKKLEEFLNNYQNSVWFEKGFEALCRIYYETPDTENAIKNLQRIIDTYQRRDTIDYAYLVMGILYYGKPDYNKAAETLNKIPKEFPKSVYFYAASTLIEDINQIKKGSSPSYSFGSKDFFRMWEAYTPIGAAVNVSGDAEVLVNDKAKEGELFIKTKPASKMTFTVTGAEDLDRFNEYWQDKDDQSRLPREIKTGTEKDLVFLTWSCPENGKFLDDKQAPSRAWQSPDSAGSYTVTINVGDIALVRPPDNGTRKDSAKVLTIYVTVEK